MPAIATFEEFTERDAEYLDNIQRELGVSVQRRTEPSGDEYVLLVEHRDLPLSDIDKMPDLQTILMFERGRATLPYERLSARGIDVRIIHNLGGLGVAEHTFALMLALKKKIIDGHRAVKESHWRQGVDEPLYTDQRAHVFNWSGIEGMGWLYGQTIGIVGFGRIGKAVARRALAFDMDVLYFNRHRLAREAEADLGVRFAELDQLVENSDVICLHVPYTVDTEHLIGEEQFARMKPTALLINVARGRVVNETALISALQQKTIAGAGLDVLVYEPPRPDNPLLELDNVVLSPHIAGVYDPIARKEQFRLALKWSLASSS